MLSLSTPLSIIYTHSLESRRVPTAWKKAIITPIFKKGDKLSASNYRPISLTSVASKVCERIMVDQLQNFTLTHNILPVWVFTGEISVDMFNEVCR